MAKNTKARQTRQKLGEETYWQTQIRCFIESAKKIPTAQFGFSALMDFGTVALNFFLLILSLNVATLVSLKMVPQLYTYIQLVQAGDVSGGLEFLKSIAPQLANVFIVWMVIFVVASLVGLLIYSWLQGAAWAKAQKRTLDAKGVLRYFLVNLVWAILWSILALLTIIAFTPMIAVSLLFGEMIILLYFDSILRAVFDYKRSFGNFKMVAKLGVHVLWFLPALIIWCIVFIIFITALTPILGSQALLLAGFVILMLLLAGWIRLHAIALAESLARLLKHKL